MDSQLFTATIGKLNLVKNLIASSSKMAQGIDINPPIKIITAITSVIAL